MKTQLPERSKKIASTLEKLKKEFTEYYKHRLIYMILYGSYARGDFRKYSDIDILVVLNEIRSEMQEIDKLAELKTDILLDSDVYISTNPVSIDKINNSDFTFYKNIQKEGIII
jgi:predicted nucleotidyltransferase